MCYLFKFGDMVFVEDLGYYIVFGLLWLYGVKLVGILCCSDGLDVEVIEVMLCEYRFKLFFINSVLQNFIGLVVLLLVVFWLLELVWCYGFIFLEDDIFVDLQVDLIVWLVMLDQFDYVIYVGGFFKMVLVLLLVGYLIVKCELVYDLINVKMFISVGGLCFVEVVVSMLLECGVYCKYVEWFCQCVGDFVIVLFDVLVDVGWEVFYYLFGGNFLWVWVLYVEDLCDLVVIVEKYGVMLVLGYYFCLNLEVLLWVCINSVYVMELCVVVFLQEVGCWFLCKWV